MLGIILASHGGLAERISELGEICLDNVSHWKNFNYTIEQNEQIIELITKQIDYLDRLPSFELTEEEKKYIIICKHLHVFSRCFSIENIKSLKIKLRKLMLMNFSL
ncbi:MAG: hypothetical protein Q4B23_05605 [Helcococcus sp.]|nr:hypothetical protein [Helcococcus sp.]